MAIGPQSDRMASGRLVVIATVYGLLGAAAGVLGVGPQVRPAPDGIRLVGLSAIALGSVLLLAAVTLALRARGARAVGAAGGAAAAALGAIVGFLSLASLDDCTVGGRNVTECHALIGAVGLAGLVVAAFGLGSMIVILRARPSAFRRQRR
jgi:hypothetical protein